MTTPQTQHITLSLLQAAIRETLEERFPAPLWVCAEIADVKINSSSGHCYMELVEKDEKSDSVARAQARAVIWRSNYMRIAGLFEAASGSRLERGIKILVRATVTYHELYGLSLQIIDIDPAYTMGDMELRKQQTIAMLRSDGVWDMNRETQMPAVVQRIAVVSSRTAAGFQDFLNELHRYSYGFAVTLFEAVMQGAASEESITGALGAVAERCHEFDAVIIIRGGGAVTDLNCFNSYRIASYIAQFPIPVLTGIGHDKDVSVADMVAHTALKTPTAVAVWLCDRMAGVEAALESAAVQLHELYTTAARNTLLRIERMTGTLRSSAESLIAAQRQRTAMAGEMLIRDLREALHRQKTRLNSMQEIAESRSPKSIMRMGFAVARVGGRVILSSKELNEGEKLTVELADGSVITEVKKSI
ncbi:MAG: exodeoxyribonuclease VII large subunit [Alistipes sp.]|nr:exodeoxyribonuclease VII large subunit [Alistipes sp.]